MSFRSHNELYKHVRVNGHVCGEPEEVDRPVMDDDMGSCVDRCDDV